MRWHLCSLFFLLVHGTSSAQALNPNGERIKGILTKRTSGEPTPAEYSFRVPEDGSYWIDLHSHDFDAVLTLRDAHQSLLGHDDNGWFLTHSRLLSSELETGTEYRIQVDSANNQIGQFHLQLHAGTPESISSLEKRHLEVEDLRKKLTHLKQSAQTSDLDLAINRFEFGRRLLDIGNYETARQPLEQALATIESQKPIPLLLQAQILQALGEGLENLSLFEEAESYTRKALQTYQDAPGENSVATAKCRRDLGWILCDQKRWQEAESCFQIATDTLSTSVPFHAVELAWAQQGMGLALIGQGKHVEARPLLQEALETYEQTLGPQHALPSIALNNLGAIYLTLGDFELAEKVFAKSLEICKLALGVEHPVTLIGFYNLAFSKFLLGRREDAWQDIYQAASLSRRSLDRRLPTLSTAQRWRTIRNQKPVIEMLLNFTLQLGDPEINRAAYSLHAFWKGQIGRSLRQTQRQLLQNADPQLIDLRNQLDSVTARLTYLFNLPIEEVLDREEFGGLIGKREQIYQDISDNLQKYDDHAAEIQQLLDLLPEDAAYIDFLVYRYLSPEKLAPEKIAQTAYWGEDHLLVWVLRPHTNEIHCLDLGNMQEHGRLLQSYLSHELELGNAGGFFSRQDRFKLRNRIYAGLLAPIMDHLQGVRMLVLSPDQLLAALPFEILPGKDKEFLLEEFEITYVGDLSALDLLLPETGLIPDDRPPSFLAVGGVHYAPDKGEQQTWPFLPATITEIQTLGEMFWKFNSEADASCMQVSGAAATARRLRQEMPKFQNIHLATHGFFARQVPYPFNGVSKSSEPPSGSFQSPYQPPAGLRSGLVLAGDNPAEGYLTAEEIQWMNLTGTDLVVLSACEAALGVSEAAEGLISLRRAFHQAGARSVISPLWTLNDTIARVFMEKFYARLWQGASKIQALRQTQLDLLQYNRQVYGHGRPKDWGAFVLSGYWR